MKAVIPRLLDWSVLLALAAFGLWWGLLGQAQGTGTAVLAGAGLVVAVVAGVHHAEVVAHRVGEPLGTLVLALAITVIEVGLIASIMLGGGPGAGTLARDTLFATVMIVCNGVVGACLALGALRHHVLAFRVEGASQALAALVPMVVLTLVLPSHTTTTPGPTYSHTQLAFAGSASLVVYAVFVFIQTIRHRDDFVQADRAGVEVGAPRPSVPATWVSALMLAPALVAVVGLAKWLAPAIERGLQSVNAPTSAAGLVVALIVLAPESVAALRAASRNHMQTSLNLALGSALASIGLTIPAVAVLSVLLEKPLVLGLGPAQTVLLSMTLLLSAITLASGRATVLHGAVHVVVFGSFLVFSFVP